METDTKHAISTKGRSFILYGFAIGFGIIMATAAILISKFALLAIPIIAYSIAVILNVLSQKSICHKANVSQAFSLALIQAIVVFIMYLASNYVSFMGSPIAALFPNSGIMMQKQLTLGFYAFWAGLYAQIISGGFLQACPK
jgi:hypothetical protein